MDKRPWRQTTSWTARLAAMLALGPLQGCGGVQVNEVQSIALVTNSPTALNRLVAVGIRGSGSCGNLRIDWGDGATTDISGDITYRPGTNQCHWEDDIITGIHQYICFYERREKHTYTGWGGGKTITAIAQSGCEGRVNTRFTVEPPVTVWAFARPGPNACDPVPGMPALASPSLVKITTVPSIGAYSCGIANAAGDCYDPDGWNSTVGRYEVAPSNFPFPGRRSYALILRVGAQIEQGGTNMQFVATGADRLELCLNDPSPSTSRGGYEIDIRVDQLGPPP